jgi:hypothetical protein
LKPNCFVVGLNPLMPRPQYIEMSAKLRSMRHRRFDATRHLASILAKSPFTTVTDIANDKIGEAAAGR